MKRKFKKPASLSKKRTLVMIEEEEPEPAKKVEAQVKKVLRRSRHETIIHKAGGSGDGTGSTLGIPDEPKGKSVDTHEGTGLKPGVPNVSTTNSFKSENKSWGDSGDEANEQGDDEDVLKSDDDLEQADDERTESDNPRTSDKEEETQDNEYVHTPEDYVPTNDETNDESNDVDVEEYDRIDKELYGDVNVRLTNLLKKKKTTWKTKVPLRSSSMSFDYAAKYLNLDNIPSTDTEVVSMMDINSQLLQQWSQLLRQQLFHLFFLYSFLTSQQSTPILTPTTTEATTLTIAVPKSETLYALYQRISDLEKDVKELNTVDQSLALLLTIKYEVPNAVKEYLGTSLDDALYKVLKKHDVDIIKEHSVRPEIVERLR
ncbi:hypothetical protein Tco_0807205 [Tanacetum coccineum]